MKNILTLYGAELRQEIMNNHFVSVSLNYVKDSDRLKDYFKGKGYFGACMGYSYDTIFGPLSANIHWSNLTNKLGLYISAGYNF
jgi:NTE family protein